jgi:hypothetical protein
MKKNRYPAAFASMSKLRTTDVMAARDLYYAHVQLVEENKVSLGSHGIRFRD